MINDGSERESQIKKQRNPSGPSADWWPPLFLVPEKKNDFQEFLAPAPLSMEVKPHQRLPSCPALYLMLQLRTNVLSSSWISILSSATNANKFNRALQSKLKSCYPQVSCLSHNMAAFLAPSTVVKSIETTRVAFGCNLPLGMRPKGWSPKRFLISLVIFFKACTKSHHGLGSRR